MVVPRPTIKASKTVLTITLAASLCPVVPAMANEVAPQPEDDPQLAEGLPANVGWSRWNGCEWRISNGDLTIRPASAENGPVIEPGSLNGNYWDAPWKDYLPSITSATFENGVFAIGEACSNLFQGAGSLQSVDLSGLDTSRATSMDSMFDGCTSLKALDISKLDTSNVTSMNYMFYGCSSLTTIGDVKWDTRSLTRMKSMFCGCSSLPSINLKGFDTTNVTVMGCAFDGCKSLKEIDLSGFDISKVSYLDRILANCTSLETVSLPKSSAPSNKSTKHMFTNCTSLRTLDLTGFDTSNVISIGGMFANCTSLESINVSSLDTSKVTSAFGLYSYGSAGPGFEAGIFAGCKSLKTVDLSNWDLSNTDDLSYCFAGCSSLESVKLPSKPMNSCLWLTGLFLDCSSLKSFDLSSINAPNATDISGMFSMCESLSSVTAPSGCLPKATSVGGMFYGCKSLTNLDLTGLGSQTISNLNCRYKADYDYAPHPPTLEEVVGPMGVGVGLFEGCSSLQSLALPDWDTSQVKKDSEAATLMFEGCNSLEKISVGEHFQANPFPRAGSSNADATGSWVDIESGATYTPASVPANTSATYVSQLTLNAKDFAIDASKETYTGRPIMKKVVTDLVEGRDYTVEYKDNTEPGTAMLTISGTGRYCGALEYKFEISKQTDSKPDNPGTEDSAIRVAGDEAADTSAKIAQAAFPEGSEWVVIARDDDFADAMSATGLAGALEAPIVLTDRNGLSNAAADAVKGLGAKKAYIIGGKGAIPGNLESELKAIGCQVIDRVFGNESWDTSAACAKMIAEHGGNPNGDAIVAMSSNFQDALSISSFAYKYKVPIFLETNGNERELPSAAREAIENQKGTIYVPGGPGAVPKSSVEDVFGKDRVARIFGENGYDTSNQIATYMVNNNLLSANTVCIASGAPAPKGVDALAGAALAGKAGGVMLLANDNPAFGEVDSTAVDGSDSQGTPAFLASHAPDVGQAYLLGGNAVIGADLQRKVTELLGRQA